MNRRFQSVKRVPSQMELSVMVERRETFTHSTEVFSRAMFSP